MTIPYFAALSAVAVAFCVTMTAEPALAGPPLITDDAGTVDVGKGEVELNGSSRYNKERAAGVITRYRTLDAETKITTGLCQNVGVSLAIPYTVSVRVEENDRPIGTADGFGDATLEIKYVFAELAGVRFAFKPSIIIPTGNYSAGLSEGGWQPGSTLIATKEFGDGTYLLHANLGYEHHYYRSDEARGANRANLWSASVAGEARVVKRVTVVADVGLSTTADRSTAELSGYALAGASCEINDHLAVNAGIKLGLTRPEDDVAALYGMVVKF